MSSPLQAVLSHLGVQYAVILWAQAAVLLGNRRGRVGSPSPRAGPSATRRSSRPGSTPRPPENAYITYNGLRPVAFDPGYLDGPFTLDEATSSNDIMFIDRAGVQNVVSKPRPQRCPRRLR